MAWLTGALVVTSALSIFLAGFQVYMARAQLRAYQAAERARVSVAGVEGKLTDAKVFLPIENFGRVTSPRVIISAWSFRLPVGGTVPDYSQLTRLGGEGTEIPPGASKFGATVPIANGDIADAEVRNIEQGRKRLFIVGRIEYDNGFGGTEESQTCFVYDHASPNRWSVCTVGQRDALPLTPAPKPSK